MKRQSVLETQQKLQSHLSMPLQGGATQEEGTGQTTHIGTHQETHEDQ